MNRLGGSVLVVAVAFAAATASGPAPASTAPVAFRIGGVVRGLYPGARRPLVLRVLNSTARTVTITSVTTWVTSPKPSCPASNLGVSHWWGSLRLGPGAASHVTVTAVMSHAAPNACQATAFGLRYVGTGFAQ